MSVIESFSNSVASAAFVLDSAHVSSKPELDNHLFVDFCVQTQNCFVLIFKTISCLQQAKMGNYTEINI